MKITHSRGMAALCLLCVLPKLGATVLTFDYAHTRYFVGGSDAPISAAWTPDLTGLSYDAVQVDISWTVEIYAVNSNPYSVPRDWSVFTYWTPQASLTLPNGTFSSMAGARQGITNAALVPALGSISLNETFNQTFSFFVSGDALTGSTPLSIILYGGMTHGAAFGSGFHKATHNVTLTTFTIDDAGSTLALWALPALIVFSHRVRRWFFTGQ